MTLSSNTPAIVPGNTASFQASGGVEPYVYSILTSGAGGDIDPDTGDYTAPLVAPDKGVGTDVIQAVDANNVTVTLPIKVGSPLFLLCNIIQREMGLADNQAYLWDQKIDIPKDENLYVIVAVTSEKPFGNTSQVVPSGGGMTEMQSINVMAKLDINILSRGPAARERRDEILLALGSVFAEQQMNSNGFFIGRLSTGFVNLSEIDGSAIPYRYVISVNMQYVVKKVKAAQYYDDFPGVTVTTEP